MIKRELVEQERWVEPPRFNRLLAIYQLLPGPEAHELCVHLGMLKGGRLGGFLAGLGFMLPGLLLMLLLAALYGRLNLGQPGLAAVFLGIQIAVLAVVVRAVQRLADHAVTSTKTWAIALLCFTATLLGVSFWIVLAAAGAAYVFDQREHILATVAVLAAAIIIAALTTVRSSRSRTRRRWVSDASPLGLLLTGLKAGLLTFGGAYTAIPFVREDTVGRGWLADAQFLDGLALSQIIPAPLVIFATFVGYLAAGPLGALAITAGIFLPAFSFGLLFGDRLDRIVDEPRLHLLLEGVAIAVIGIIAATAAQIGWSLVGRVPAIVPGLLIFAAALAALIAVKWRLTVLFVLPLAAAAGWIVFR